MENPNNPNELQYVPLKWRVQTPEQLNEASRVVWTAIPAKFRDEYDTQPNLARKNARIEQGLLWQRNIKKHLQKLVRPETVLPHIEVSLGVITSVGSFAILTTVFGEPAQQTFLFSRLVGMSAIKKAEWMKEKIEPKLASSFQKALTF